MSEAINSSMSAESLNAEVRAMPTSANQPMLTGMIGVFAAATITFLALWGQYPWFKVSSDFDIGMGASNDARMQLLNQMQIAANQNSCALLAMAGGFLGTALSVISPGCCSMLTRIMAGWGVGMLWGGLVGYLASASYTLFVPRGALPSVTGMVGVHAFTYGLLGLGLGALYGGYSQSAKGIVSRLLGGLVGGAVGGLLFAILVGFVGETQKGTELIPTGAMAQAMWVFLPCLAIGWGILQQPKPRKAAAAV